ncbi:hypothetical protein FOTG_06233 [Fusarium oxysporum f. sp. vasinfectum 25433]|uniref:Uncharacterized protein n=1 Tax=Fusarium oxysporum f. sp. vasinfectum 25433 TaxID=1089449 RepID=X0M3M4_FUSOX|nr:hypothetical protein FOTG_06233 [Fusarium oxysporum f. sp. vasinfectum 25433]
MSFFFVRVFSCFPLFSFFLSFFLFSHLFSASSSPISVGRRSKELVGWINGFIDMVTSDFMIIATIVSSHHGFGALRIRRLTPLILAVRDIFFLLRFSDEIDGVLQVVSGLMATIFGITENLPPQPLVLFIQVLTHLKGGGRLAIDFDRKAPALDDVSFHRSVDLETSATSCLLALFLLLLQLLLLVVLVYAGYCICSIPLVEDDFVSGHSRLHLRGVFVLCQGIYVNRFLDTVAFGENPSWLTALNDGRFWVREGGFDFSLEFHISIKD